MYKLSFLFLFLMPCIYVTVLAQLPEVYQQTKLAYPDANAVILEDRENLNISLIKGKIKIVSSHHLDKIILNDKAQAYANEYIYYDDTFNEVYDINALLLTPSGNSYKKQKIKTIETKSKMNNSIFYHDNKIKEIVYPKVGPGSRAVVSYTEITKDPHFLGAFFFSSYIPAVKMEFSVTFPDKVKIQYKIFNDDDKITFSEIKNKNTTTYQWNSVNSDKYNWNQDALPISYVEPHVIVFVDEYEKDGKQEKVLSDVNELYKWYWSLMKNINKTHSKELEQIVVELTKQAGTESEKIKKIFYWVQDNIKYVAFEDGLSGFIPRDASTVLSKRYGDCKDMASIIVEMLKYANINAHFTWIGTRKIPYSYLELHTPMVDNHMIASVKLDEKYIFLDATGQFIPFGLPSSFIQSKEAMIGITDEKMEVVKVPVVDMNQNSYMDSSIVWIDNNSLKGKSIGIYTGYSKINVIPQIIDHPYKKQLELLGELMEKGHNKYRVDTFTLQGINDRDNDLQINYEFTVPDYVKTSNEKIYINLNLDRVYFNEYVEKENYDQDLIINYKFIEKHTTNLQIPAGYKIKTIPENSSFKHPDFGFSVIYVHNGITINLEKTVYVNTILLKKNDLQEWNKMIDHLNKAYSEVVVLEK